MGVVHLAVSLQIALCASPYRTLVRTLMLMLYPAALALTGLGALLLERWPRLGREEGTQGAGALLVLFLGILLVAPFTGDQQWDLMVLGFVVLTTLGGWYLLLGAAIAASLHRLRENHHVSQGWGCHLVGLMLGYGFSELLVTDIGANAVILLTGLALIVGGRKVLAVWALSMALAFWVPIDHALEDLRNAEVLLPDSPEIYDQDGRAAAGGEITETRWYGWSRRSQVRLVDISTGRGLREQYRVLYNFANQYRVVPAAMVQGFRGESTMRRAGIYSALSGSERVLLIGAGAGRGLLSMPVTLDERVHAVERNPTAAHLFQEVAPELNGHLYDRVQLHAADGRTILERLPAGWDAIVVESSLYHPAHLLLPAAAPYFHQTAEAYGLMVERLTPEGVLIIEYNRTANAPNRRDMARRARTALLKAGMEVSVLSSGPLQNLYVMACKQQGCGERIKAQVEVRSQDNWLSSTQQEDFPALVDDRPFMTWDLLLTKEKALLQSIAGGFILLALGLTFRETRRVRSPGTWRGASAFVLLVGIGHMAIQLHAFHLARTFFADSVRTVLVLIVLFLGWGALGSLAAGRLPQRISRKWLGFTVGAVLLVLHWTLLSHLPFSDDREWFRWLVALIATLPGGFLMGAILPLGLRRASSEQLRSLMAIDAAGTLAGYALLYLVMLPLGVQAFGILAVASYLGALWLLVSQRTQ